MNRKLSMIIFYVDIALMLIFILSRWQVRITLNGDESATAALGHEYVDMGATATFTGRDIHAFDGDVKVRVNAKHVDTDTPGTYTVTYKASRLFWSDKAERTVTVVDDNPPVLSLGEVNTYIDGGGEWTDNYSAMDDRDGNLTSQVLVSGNLDLSHVGLYEIDYSVTDSSGNTATASREVRVIGTDQPVTGSKIVFLTFDDGPWDATDELLDVLAKHNVKVTFFVTSNHPEYIDCIGREFREGHTVAVHTYTHDFDQVYASSDAYWSDFERMNDVIAEQCGGYRSIIFRFPGGASNTISSFNPGIMTRLTQEAAEKGLDYFDWNVDCGDGGGLNDTPQLYQNIINGISANDISVVLCHDTHTATVRAIDDVLTWGEQNGYTFLPLGRGVYTCHHSVAN